MSVQSVIMEENQEERDDLLISIEYLRSFNEGLRAWKDLDSYGKHIYYIAFKDLANKFSKEICEEFVANFKCEFGDMYWDSYAGSHIELCDYDEVTNHTQYNFDESDVEDWVIGNVNTFGIDYVDDNFVEEYVLDHLDKFKDILEAIK